MDFKLVKNKVEKAYRWCRARWAEFRTWQLTPVAYPELDPEEYHTCINCGEFFHGVFCPRCGQNARIGRMNLKGAMQGFMDVWGMGSRSFPRAIIHLLFRPGYMITDYIDGRRQAFFPPFKMLFIVTTLALVVGYLIPDATDKSVADKSAVPQTEVPVPGVSDSPLATAGPEESDAKITENNGDAEELAGRDLDVSYRKGNFKVMARRMIDAYESFAKANKALTLLLHQLLFTIGVFVFFHKSRNFRQLSFSEQFIGQTLIATQLQFLSILYMLMTLRSSEDAYAIPGWMFVLVLLIDYKQLYRYGWVQTILRTVGAAMLVFFLIIMTCFLIGVGYIIMVEA